MRLSRSDYRLLAAVQKDVTRSQAELAEIAGMSRSSVWRRIREFEDSGLIRGKVALLDAEKAGFQIQVLLSVAMAEHDSRHEFERHVHTLPEVIACFAISGERDYVLHVVAKDMKAYNLFLNAHILSHATVGSASSSFVLRSVKFTTEMPLPP
jgi:Lrp/AsnC family transcriptional regulator, leucine-responsive regulatory protein